MTSGTPARIAASKGGRSTASSSARERVIVTPALSVFASAAAEARKVLGRRGDTACAPSRHGVADRAADRGRIAGERTLRKGGSGNVRDVGHGREADRDSDRAERPPGGLGVCTYRASGELIGRRKRGRGPGDASDVPTLLVDRDDRSTPVPAKNTRELAQLIR